jgi:hypothetical protein
MLLKLGYDVPVSNFAFKFKLRRYNMAAALEASGMSPVDAALAGAYIRQLLSST